MFIIKGRYRGKTEEIDSFETKKEAVAMLQEYVAAFGPGWHLWIEG